MQQRVGEVVERDAHAAEFAAEHAENRLELRAPRLRMIGHAEVSRLPDRLVKAEARRAAALRRGRGRARRTCR